MIVTPVDGGLRVVTQNDHAHLAAAILALWHADGLPQHPRRRELLFAAREHDNGWRETDSAPFCDTETGRPHDFLSLPHDERRRIWHRGPARYVEREPWAAVLITRHAQHLHRTYQGDESWRTLFAEWDERVDKLCEELSYGPDEVEADYRWIDLSDTLSLAVCAGWGVVTPMSLECRGYRVEPLAGVDKINEISVNEIRVEPFPLAGATTFEVACRTIPDRRYRSAVDLGTELASARWGTLAFRIL